jgi:hypothetical protein
MMGLITHPIHVPLHVSLPHSAHCDVGSTVRFHLQREVFAKEADTEQLGYENWHLELTFVVSAVP